MVWFPQIALNAEAVSKGWAFNGYGLIPVGDAPPNKYFVLRTTNIIFAIDDLPLNLLP